jgi:hypothetical protein
MSAINGDQACLSGNTGKADGFFIQLAKKLSVT